MIRLGRLSELERSVIELRYVSGERDGARILRAFAIGETAYLPGRFLSDDEVENVSPRNLRTLQAAGYIEIVRGKPKGWRPPRTRGKARRGRPPSTGRPGPMTYEAIAEELGLANASVARKAEKRGLAKIRKVIEKKGK